MRIHRVYHSEYAQLIGKWIFAIDMPSEEVFEMLKMPRTTRKCVVDDFGNLVGV